MACSIEARVPFLDNDLVDLALKIPESLKVRGTTTKYLLKKVAARHVPLVVSIDQNGGLLSYMKDWLRGELTPMMDELLSEERLKKQRIFNPARSRPVSEENTFLGGPIIAICCGTLWCSRGGWLGGSTSRALRLWIRDDQNGRIRRVGQKHPVTG